MHYFAALIFLLVGFTILTLITTVLLIMTRWRAVSPRICTAVVFLLTAVCFLSRYGWNWHTLLRPLVISILFYAAMEIGCVIARQMPEGENPNKLW